jgi:hypothetical protein
MRAVVMSARSLMHLAKFRFWRPAGEIPWYPRHACVSTLQPFYQQISRRLLINLKSARIKRPHAGR